ncbi:MAG: NADPH:quinone reductase [bacterium]|nr:NADPH:quinone reductase [bacterium]
MKAAFIHETGKPDVIQFGELPKPEPKSTEVLIEVKAVSVNPVDTYIRNGANYWELPDPFIIGCDVAGVVAEVGSDVTRFKVGDRVWGTNQGLMGRNGTFAEFVAVDEEWLYASPENVSDETLAAGALVGVTAHLGLFRQGKLQAGEKLFLHGGSGGVGSMVLQMAKAVGAEVMTTGGSDAKVQLCRELGADVVANYKTESVQEMAAEFAPQGFNVFWETQREPDFDLIVSQMAERGRIILMAGRDARPEFPVGPFYVKECSLIGVVMFKATPDELRTAADAMNQWYADGKLTANIGQRFPLSQAADAHRLQEENTLNQAGTLVGKIVLTVE